MADKYAVALLPELREKQIWLIMDLLRDKAESLREEIRTGSAEQGATRRLIEVRDLYRRLCGEDLPR